MSPPRIVNIAGGIAPVEGLLEAAKVIRNGGIVVHPTETLYGLAVDPWNEEAVGRLVTLKGRESRAGLIVIVASREEAGRIASIAEASPAARLIEAFWPGPLTLILPPSPEAPRSTLGPRGGIAIRHTTDPVALALIRAAGRPLTSTSANRSGEAPATTGESAAVVFGDAVALVLDAGARASSLASTIVDLTGIHPVILREGAIARERIEAVLDSL